MVQSTGLNECPRFRHLGVSMLFSPSRSLSKPGLVVRHLFDISAGCVKLPPLPRFLLSGSRALHPARQHAKVKLIQKKAVQGSGT